MLSVLLALGRDGVANVHRRLRQSRDIPRPRTFAEGWDRVTLLRRLSGSVRVPPLHHLDHCGKRNVVQVPRGDRAVCVAQLTTDHVHRNTLGQRSQLQGLPLLASDLPHRVSSPARQPNSSWRGLGGSRTSCQITLKISGRFTPKITVKITHDDIEIIRDNGSLSLIAPLLFAPFLLVILDGPDRPPRGDGWGQRLLPLPRCQSRPVFLGIYR